MKLFISYFYQIRFFKPYMIPLSTALYDPKWYHDFKGSRYIFKDKNRVYNGFRIKEFRPGRNCSSLCRGPDYCNSDPSSCEFLKRYYNQLSKLNFNSVISGLEEFSGMIKDYDRISEEVQLILIVHEAPSNKCSERVMIRKWFNDNGMYLPEWSK